jgi:tRNA-Thr(GGU) m(6)t(6)A37 methyltransferase TsaA
VIIEMQPVGFVSSRRTDTEDDLWGEERSCIELSEGYTAAALAGLADFSHVEVLFVFHAVDAASIATGARHPRGNPAWPAVGIFAQRGRNRPNRIGSTMCRVLNVEGTRLHVAELDAIDGTPVLDIKPVMAEFLPRQPVRQPAWASELMSGYWTRKA